MLAYESFLPGEDLLHLWYKVLLILGQHHLDDSKECLVPRAMLKLENQVPQGREWRWESFGSPGTDVGRMGIMRVLWMNQNYCLPGLGPLGYARTAQLPESWNRRWRDRESLQCTACPFSLSPGLSWQHNSMPAFSSHWVPACVSLTFMPSGALHRAGVRPPQAGVNRMEPRQEIQPKGPPYLVQRDDPVGLIGRFPLDVDLLLKGPPLDGL